MILINFRINRWLILAGVIFTSCQFGSKKSDDQLEIKSRRPNIIYILADDLGYGDLSCYGQKKFSTPNIDQLAGAGMKFISHYSGSTVCAPSRSALLTGLHTGHTPIRGNREVKPEGQYPLPDSILTLPEILKQAGYITGAFGKWGLGPPGSEGDPLRQGFDHFFGYNCQRLAHNYFPGHLWSNTDQVQLKGNEGNAAKDYAPEVIHMKALEFIEQNKDTSFFLFIPTPLPHAELLVPESELAKTRGKYDPEFTYNGVDSGEDYRKGPYGSQPEPHAAYVAMINILDRQVGEIIAKVKALGIEDNTVIIFTSDNGPHQEGGGDPDYFDSNGPLRGYKRDLYEGGIRVPMLAIWPGKIKAGSTTDHVSAFWDVMPTVAEMAGASIREKIDGISFLPTLLGKGRQPHHKYLYWEFHEKGGRIAVRKDHWKAVKYNVLKDPDGPLELYDLESDLHEEKNVADLHPEIILEMEKNILKEARTESNVFQFSSSAHLNVK